MSRKIQPTRRTSRTHETSTSRESFTSEIKSFASEMKYISDQLFWLWKRTLHLVYFLLFQEKESLRCPKCPTSLKTKYGRYVHIISRHSEDVATDFSEHSGGATHTGVEADQQGHSDNTVISAYPVMMLSSYRFVVGNIAEYELTSPPSVKIA